MTAPDLDAAAWSRHQLAAVALVTALAPLLVIVRVTEPDTAPVTATIGFCVAVGALVTSFVVRRRVRSLNRPEGIDAARARRIGEANKSGTVPRAEDVPAARMAYSVGVAEWTRFAWAFAGMLHVGLAWGLAESPGVVWKVVVGVVLSVFALVMGAIAVLSVLRLRTRLVALPTAFGDTL